MTDSTPIQLLLREVICPFRSSYGRSYRRLHPRHSAILSSDTNGVSNGVTADKGSDRVACHRGTQVCHPLTSRWSFAKRVYLTESLSQFCHPLCRAVGLGRCEILIKSQTLTRGHKLCHKLMPADGYLGYPAHRKFFSDANSCFFSEIGFNVRMNSSRRGLRRGDPSSQTKERGG